MKRAAVVAFVLFAFAASAVADPRKRDTAAPAQPTTAISAGGIWSCDPGANPTVLAQTDPAEKQGCVTLHGDRKAKARVFGSSSVFATVCPVVFESFSYDSGCTSGAVLPKIAAGDTMDLRFRNGKYWLSVNGANGSILAGVALDPVRIERGTDTEKVEGYAWLKGSNGGVDYYVYIDGAMAHVADNHDKRFIVEIYDPANTTCASHKPEVSALQDKDCKFAATGPLFFQQGGTGPGGEPPPTKK